MIKEEEEIEELKEVVLEHANVLKDIFIQIASKSAFPQIGWNDFS